MNELRKKLAIPFDGLKTNTLNDLEQIVDDYALKFFIWTYSDDAEAVFYNLKSSNDFREPIDKQLLQYFKDNVYGKE